IGQILGIAQTIPQTAFGIAWSADQDRLVAGDFDGDGKVDLFFQATSATGTHALVLNGANGFFDWISGGTSNCGYAHGPQQCWSDSYLGFKWSTKTSVVYAGDFTGDGKSDLLVQAKPNVVLIDYDVMI